MAGHLNSDEAPKSTEDGVKRLPYAARAAMCFMRVDDMGDDVALYRQLYDQLCDVLGADSRVETLEAPTQDTHTFYRPALSRGGIDPSTYTHAFYFKKPMILEVRAPRGVQPTFKDSDEIPADRYWAAWDGIALVVLWRMEYFGKSQRDRGDLDAYDILVSLSPSGGLIVQSILEDAAKKCGCEFSITPCSPDCDYRFVHTGLLVETVTAADPPIFEPDDTFARVRLPVLNDSPESAVKSLHGMLAPATYSFAQMRSEGRTAVAAAQLAHTDLQELLEVNWLFEVNRDGVSARLQSAFSGRLRCVRGAVWPGCRRYGRACAGSRGCGSRMPGGLRAWRAGSGSRRWRS